MKRFIALFVIIMLFIGCAMESKKTTWIEEIKQTEKAFADMLAREGMHDAFVAFAAEDAVLLRNEELIVGKQAIDDYYRGVNATGLVWEPDHIEVAGSGDLAYTYGKYTYTYQDKEGNIQQSTGVFHTVWKRQNDGSWKYVWD